MGFQSIADFGRTSTIEAATTCLHLRVGRDAYVSDCSTENNSDRTDGQTDTASMTADWFGKATVISSKQIKDEMPLALLPRDSITKAVSFTRKFKVTLGSKAK